MGWEVGASSRAWPTSQLVNQSTSQPTSQPVGLPSHGRTLSLPAGRNAPNVVSPIGAFPPQRRFRCTYPSPCPTLHCHRCLPCRRRIQPSGLLLVACPPTGAANQGVTEGVTKFKSQNIQLGICVGMMNDFEFQSFLFWRIDMVIAFPVCLLSKLSAFSHPHSLPRSPLEIGPPRNGSRSEIFF